jgi:hypothetical protein
MSYDDAREAVAIIPPGCSTEQVSTLMEALNACCPGHDLLMGNQEDGSIAIFYYRDLEEARKRRANTQIIEEADPNVELALGFEQDGEHREFKYAATESDEAILGLASFMVPVLESWDAANYVTTTILHENTKYGFTIQRATGYTPAEKIAQLEARIAELEAS